ncbi:MAG: DUF3341 domain-containing protein [Candidatus Sulfotelmatobacter sp.]
MYFGLIRIVDLCTKSVFGIHFTRGNVESAVDALKLAGFSSSEVSVLLPKNLETAAMATEHSTKAPEGAAVGVGSGAAVGGALGWFVGVGALAIPGIGPVIAAGPLVAVLAGIGIGGALGGFAGSLVGLGIPENEARKYESELLKGGILVVVHCKTAEESNCAEQVFQSSGAQDIAMSQEVLPETQNAV